MLATTPLPDLVDELARKTPCRVQKASVDADGRLTLELYVVREGDGQKGWLVVDRGALAWFHERPAREPIEGPPPAAQALVRKELVPGVLADITWAPPLVRMTFATAGAPRPRIVVIERIGDARMVLMVAAEEGSADAPRVLGVLGPARPVDGRDLRRGKPYVAPLVATAYVEGVRAVLDGAAAPGRTVDPLAQLRQALKAEGKRVKRLVDALTGDLTRHGDGAVHELEGELLKTVLGKIPRGSTSVDVVDWQGNPRTLTLDPAKDARTSLADRFKRARRARASDERTAPRLAEAQARLAAVDDARRALAGPVPPAADVLRASALLARPETGGSARRRAAKAGKREAWRSFRCHSDVVVRVGRGAKDNDALVKSARGLDVWLHARNHQGAHVVVPSTGADLHPELMLDAAHLAAHFSSARGEARVDVQHARVKFVKKPGPGAPAGLVHVTSESVLHLRIEPARLAALIAREVAS